MNLHSKKSVHIPKVKLPKHPGSTTPQATPRASEPESEKPPVVPEAVTPRPTQPARQWPSAPRASVGAQSKTIGQRVQPGWIGTMGKPKAQDRWRAIYDQRAQTIQVQAGREDEQVSQLPPDDWIF